MWLLNAETLQLRWVTDLSSVQYAILSHTWDGDRELSFQDIQDVATARHKPGFAKIAGTCEKARFLGLPYVWIDTCCIDKTSSAELSEAINSMWGYYSGARICLVYLSDFEPVPHEAATAQGVSSAVSRQLPWCQWFTRGWTLQELIAPRTLCFFDRAWNFIHNRIDLADLLFRITGIDSDILTHKSSIHSIPVGRRMSWAVGRRTTRIEDRAYSLLGIFNINMPLLYGEGHKAFFRLQQHIASHYNDLSLFAWQSGPRYEDHGGGALLFSGLFAPTPDQFWSCNTLKRHWDYFSSAVEFGITNAGLRIDGSCLCKDTSSNPNDIHYLLPLDCLVDGPKPHWVAVRLRKVGDTYVRYLPGSLAAAQARTSWVSARDQTNHSFHQPPPEGPGSVYIHTLMRPEESARVKSVIESGIVLVYDEYLTQNMSQYRFLFHTQRSREVPDRVLLGPGRSFFDIASNAEDNFLCAHTVGSAPDDYVVVCKLQWEGNKCNPRVAVFKGSQLLDLVSETQNQRINIESPTLLRLIKDLFLMKCSDTSGYLDQAKMPTTVRCKVGPHLGIVCVNSIKEKDLQTHGMQSVWRSGYHVIRVSWVGEQDDK
ncbi:hypothetical protein OQA88_8278 [Cercophora sp. LCS_1]